jgi:hypothetical protein
MSRHNKNLSAVAVALLVWACNESMAPPAPVPATAGSLTAASQVFQTVVAGTAIVDLPTVLAQDADGNAVAGVEVQFAVEGGSAAGVIARTNGAGIARLTAWNIATWIGQNRVTATTAGVPPVIFTVMGVAGPPARLVKLDGDLQSGLKGSPLKVAPTIRLTDKFNNPIAGVPVTFTPSEGGRVTGGQQLTNDAGVAGITSWVLGDAPTQTLTAASGDLTPVVFSVEARAPAENCQGTLQPGLQVTSAIVAASCGLPGGSAGERWTLHNPATGWLKFTLDSDHADLAMELRDESGRLIAMKNRESGQSGIEVRALLPAGAFTVLVSTHDAGSDVPYNLVHSAGPDVVGCEEAFLGRGVTRRQHGVARTCPGRDVLADEYRVYLEGGKQIKVSVVANNYSSIRVDLHDDVSRVATALSIGWSDELVFVAPRSGYYTVVVASEESEILDYVITTDRGES